MIKAKFNNKTKELIAIRDSFSCIICSEPGSTVHHAYFGINSNRGQNRNDTDQGCILCYNCHHNLHNGKNGKILRQICIYYLKGLGNIK